MDSSPQKFDGEPHFVAPPFQPPSRKLKMVISWLLNTKQISASTINEPEQANYVG